MKQNVLEVAIKKRLGNFELNIEFQSANEVFALLGASGCGKSMTLKCIAGIETPDEGRIVLNGRVLFDSAKKINLPPQKRHVGYMFQDYALFPNMTVTKNIMAGMGKQPDMAQVEEYIRVFRLEGLEEHFPHQLSGGQKQRVAFARMLASQPEILLLDEPFSALDSHLQWEVEREMMDILDEIKKPVVFVSHNRDEVYRICDMIGVVEQGKMEAIQTKKELFENPQTVAAAKLSGCKNISPVTMISEYEMDATDWCIRFTSDRIIPADTAYVGIRAHYIEVIDETDITSSHNIVKMVVDRVIDQPFSTVFLLKGEEALEKHSCVRIEIDKGKAENYLDAKELYLHFKENTLLFLRQ